MPFPWTIIPEGNKASFKGLEMIIAMEKYGPYHKGIPQGIFLDEIRAYHALVQNDPGYVWNIVWNTVTGQQISRMEWISKMDGFVYSEKWEGSFFETKIG